MWWMARSTVLIHLSAGIPAPMTDTDAPTSTLTSVTLVPSDRMRRVCDGTVRRRVATPLESTRRSDPLVHRCRANGPMSIRWSIKGSARSVAELCVADKTKTGDGETRAAPCRSSQLSPRKTHQSVDNVDKET